MFLVKRLTLGIAAILIPFFMLLSFGMLSGCDDDGDNNIRSLTILETSDMHNHASGYGPYADYTPEDTSDSDSVTGGYARLAGEISDIRAERDAEQIPVVLVDAGDFFMGTIYDLASMPPVTLAFLKAAGYDAVTLGNHEFDWGPAGLAMMLGAGLNSGFDVPIVATTMVTDPDDSADDGIEALVAGQTIVSKKILETSNGLKIGILGVFGPDAIQDMPAAAPVTFETDYAFIQGKVDDLKQNDKVDMVVVLSHGGVETDGTGDDADLAENVTGIDVIASGHYHTAAGEALTKGESNTIIMSPGYYGQWLSRLDLEYNRKTGKVISSKYTLVPIDDTVEGDPAVNLLVENAETEINATLAQFGLGGAGDPVGSTSFTLGLEPFTESGLGNMTADALRFAASQTSAVPYDVGVVADGVIRDYLYPGKTGVITLADAYNVLPLGISPVTGTPGYPLMSVYINGPELRTMCEISASLSRALGNDFYLNVSGIRYEIDPQGTPGAMVQRVYLVPGNDFETVSSGTQIDITDETTLYHVVADYYMLRMMDVAVSMGISIVPKDSEGNPIPKEAYLDHRVDMDPSSDGIQELKGWTAMLAWFQYLAQAHGGVVPEAAYGPGGTAFGRAGILQ